MTTEPFERKFEAFLRRSPNAPGRVQQFPELLRHSFPGQNRQTGPILLAWKAGLPQELASMQMITEGFAARYAQSLSSLTHLDPERARWAVDMWIRCYAERVLGKCTETGGMGARTAPNNAESVNQDDAASAGCIRYLSRAGTKIASGLSSEQAPPVLSVPERYENMPVRAVGRDAFRGTALQVVVLGAGVRRIEQCAFSGCTRLRQVVLPEGLDVIEAQAFADCSALESMQLPMSLNAIGPGAFARSGLTEVTVPDSTASLGAGAFERCEMLERCDIGGGVRELSERLFAGCAQLTEADLPGALEKVGAEAFAHCTALRYMRIPKSVRYIDETAFNACSPRLMLVSGYKSPAWYYAKQHDLRFRTEQ